MTNIPEADTHFAELTRVIEDRDKLFEEARAVEQERDQAQARVEFHSGDFARTVQELYKARKATQNLKRERDNLREENQLLVEAGKKASSTDQRAKVRDMIGVARTLAVETEEASEQISNHAAKLTDLLRELENGKGDK